MDLICLFCFVALKNKLFQRVLKLIFVKEPRFLNYEPYSIDTKANVTSGLEFQWSTLNKSHNMKIFSLYCHFQDSIDFRDAQLLTWLRRLWVEAHTLVSRSVPVLRTRQICNVFKRGKPRNNLTDLREEVLSQMSEHKPPKLTFPYLVMQR